MKKNSAFMLRSGNKPSIAMGVSPIKDEKVKRKKEEPDEPAKEDEPDKEIEPDKPIDPERELGEYAIELGYGPRKRRSGPIEPGS